MGDKELNELLFDACNDMQSIEYIDELLSLGADINALDGNDDTPLFFAIHKKNIGLVNHLIANGANVNIQNIHNNTPLNLACITNCPTGIIKSLVDAGADIRHVWEDLTPLLASVYKMNIDAVKLLLDRGANVNDTVRIGIRGIPDNLNALMIAIDKSDVSMAKLLIDRGANINFETVGGKTPLMLACGDSLIMTKMLIDAGCDVNYKNKYDTTPLLHICNLVGRRHVYKNKKPVETIRLLIRNGADVLDIDFTGGSAWYYINDGSKISPEVRSEISKMLRTRINKDVERMEDILKSSGLDVFSARSKAIEYFDPDRVSKYSARQQKRATEKKKKGGKRKKTMHN